MKKFKRFFALVFIFIIIMSQSIFAEITMISPGENAIVYGGDFYLSIKLSGNPKLRIHIYEEQTYHIGLIEKELIISGRELSDAQGNPVTSIKYKIQGEIFEKYTDVDDLVADDLTLLAKGLGKEKEVYLSNGQGLSYFGEAEYTDSKEYMTAGKIGLYTYSFKDFETGIYKIYAEEINENEKVVSSKSFYIIVKDSSDNSSNENPGDDTPNLEDEDPIVIDDDQKESTLLEKIINFLRQIFK